MCLRYIKCVLSFPDGHDQTWPVTTQANPTTTVIEHFNYAGAVDWTTRSFKADKVNVIQQLIVQHGHGLNNAQLATISEQFNK